MKNVVQRKLKQLDRSRLLAALGCLMVTLHLQGCLIMAVSPLDGPEESPGQESSTEVKTIQSVTVPSVRILVGTMLSESIVLKMDSRTVTETDEVEEEAAVGGQTITLSSFSDSTCSTASRGLLSGASGVTDNNGNVTFDQISYDYPENIYIKAQAEDGTSLCLDQVFQFVSPVVMQQSSRADRFACATLEGALWCWGYNDSGTLGVGNFDDRYTAGLVTGLPTSVVTSVAIANQHVCAVSGGAVVCWGDNLSGQIGQTNYGSQYSTPKLVTAIASDATVVSTGATQSCAVVAGAVKCWGEHSEAGSDYTVDSIAGLESGVTQMASTNDYNNCVIQSDQIKCFGENAVGQLGNNTTTNSLAPVDVIGWEGTPQSLVGGGSHYCALNTAGDVYCWGEGGEGQLGTNDLVDRYTPTKVLGLPGPATTVSTGTNHSCAIVSHTIYCWGDNESGQLGDGTSDDRLTPTTVTGLIGKASSVAASDYQTCGVADGKVYCWGLGSKGFLGNGTTTQSLTPSLVLGITFTE